jgi:hypothetical protein
MVQLNPGVVFLYPEMGRGLAFFVSPGTKRLHVLFIPHTMRMIGEIVMPTPMEYRLRADECLRLMSEADQWYVKTALLKLAAEFQKRAERLESLSG